MFTLFAALFCAAACYWGVYRRATDVLEDYRWTRKEGTALERAIAKFDLTRLMSTAFGVVGAGLYFTSRVPGYGHERIELLSHIAEACFVVGAILFILATEQMRRARRSSCLVDEQSVNTISEPVTLRVVNSADCN